MLKIASTALVAAASLFVAVGSAQAVPGAATHPITTDQRMVVDVKRGGGRGFGGIRRGGMRFHGGRGIHRGFGGIRRFHRGGRNFGRRGRGGIYFGFGAPFVSPYYGYRSYSYSGSCRSLLRRAQRSGSSYWWNRYRRCAARY